MGCESYQMDLYFQVKALRDEFPGLDIEVDGGVSPSTIQHCAEAGANMIVSGSAIMKSSDPKGVINQLRSVVQDYSITR